jgi:hypothetical protein
MTNSLEFGINAVVRLVEPHGNVPAGASGRIVGRYARSSDPTYVVSFGGRDQGVTTEVRADEIALAHDRFANGVVPPLLLKALGST